MSQKRLWTARIDAIQFVFVLTILILAVVIRSLSIGWSGLERDEAQELNVLTEKNIYFLLSAIASDGNAPLFHLSLWPLVQLLGTWIFPEKLIALIISSSLPLCCFLLLRKRFGFFVAANSCLLTALSPVLVRYGELIRCYGLLQITALWTTVIFFDWLQEKRNGFKQYVVTVTGSMYLHPIFATVVVGHAFHLINVLLGGRCNRRFAFSWLKACVLSGILFLPWLLVLVWQFQHTLQPWSPHQSPMKLVITSIAALFTISSAPNMIVVIFVLMCCLLVSLKQTPGAAIVRAWFQILCGALGAMILLHQFGMPWRERYISVIAPVALVLVSLAAQTVASCKIRGKMVPAILFTAALIPAISLIISWVPELSFLIMVPESQFFRVARDFQPSLRNDKDLVVVAWEVACPEVSRILSPVAPVVSFPELKRVKVVRWNGLNERIRDDERMKKLCSMMDETFQQHGAILLISRAVKENVADAAPKSSLSFTEIEDLRMQQIRDWLVLHGHVQRRVIYRAREGDAQGIQFVSK